MPQPLLPRSPTGQPAPADKLDAAIHPAQHAGDSLASTEASSGKSRRVWAIALGTAAVLSIDPAIGEMAEMVTAIACTANKSLAKDAICDMRSMADQLRSRFAPLPASALAKVVRKAEAACGAVLDKGARMRELQASWDSFIACVKAPKDPGA